VSGISDEGVKHSPENETHGMVDGKRSPKTIPSYITIALSCVSVILLCAIILTALPQMYVETIEINGCDVISQEEILNDSKISKGMHLFRNISGGIVELFSFRYGNIEYGLRKKYPYISDIKIQVELPSTVKIDIVERKRIAYINLPDSYAVIDLDGYVVELVEGEVPSMVPQLNGLPVRSAVLGEKIDLVSNRDLNACLTVLGAVIAADDNKDSSSEYSLMRSIRAVRSIGNEAVFLLLYLPSTQKELLVRIGSLKDIREDMSWLRFAVEQGAFDNAGEGFLDMSGEENTFSPA
jgi:hypothetical protein